MRDTMETVNPMCEAAQQAISGALDENVALPATVLDHAEDCPACAHFLAVWTGGAAEALATRGPVAGPALRAAVLGLPQAAVASAVPTSRWPRVRRGLSAAAAVLVLGFCARLLIDVRPGETRRTDEAAQQEMAALREDMRQAVATLRQPAGALHRLLSR